MTDLLTQSADNAAMQPYWTKVDSIMAGVEALRSQSAAYMPPFPSESQASYDYRVKSSRLTDIFSDIVESLAAKPFAREAGLADAGAPAQIQAVAEDVDMMGNHLHVFAQQVFFAGIAYGLDWILVDYPFMPEGATLADERESGNRPYFVRVGAQDMLEVRSEVIAGREQFTYARINESDETTGRVRIFVRDLSGVRYELWEKPKGRDAFELAAAGKLSLSEIPLVPFYTGRRIPGSWRFTLPMKRVADLQIEHYRQETNLKLAMENGCFPMLVGKGISPPVDEKGQPITLPVGPATVLYAPMNETGVFGDWNVIEPHAATLQFLAEQVQQTETAMRELGRMPVTSGTAGITQVAAAAASARASSAAQAWTYSLKDALEKAFRYAAQWMLLGVEPTVYVNTDFAITIGGDKAPDLLLSLQKDGLISAQTLLQELKRRGILSPEVSEEDEAERVLSEAVVVDDEPMPGEPANTDREGEENGN